MIHHNDPQGSDAWLESRKGLITGSRFKDARDRLKSGQPSSKALAYARDVARERCGGTAPGAFVNSAMKFGTEQEPLARVAYEALTGNLVEEVGFITDDSGIFGLSPDGLIDDDGVLEVKTMVSSDTLFTAVADGDISAYIDQCNGYLWMLGRQWVDLALWAPDLEPLGLHLTVRRITRDEASIEALEADLLAFAALVRENEAKLRGLAAAKLAEENEGFEIMAPTPEAAPTPAAPEVVAVVQVGIFEPPAAEPLLLPDMARCCEKAAPLGVVVCPDCAEISTGYQAAMFTRPTAEEIAGGVVDVDVEPVKTIHREVACSAAPDMERMTVQAPAPPAPADTGAGAGATMKLGEVNARLAPLSLTAEGLASLGFTPVATDKNAKLYRVADLSFICAALLKHIGQVQAKLAA